MNISRKTLSNPVLIVVIFSLIALTGLFTFSNLEVNLMPNMTEPVIIVSARYENAGPQSVESAVTQVLEEELSSLSNLKKMTSLSSEGNSTITLMYNYGVNLDAATNEVRDKIENVKETLPKKVKTSVFKMNLNDFPVMDIAVHGNRSDNELKFIADKTIKRVLAQANGVSQASVYGGRSPCVCVELSQNRLAAYKLSVSDVSAKLAAENLDLGGGKITENTWSYVLRTRGEYASVKEIGDTVISTVNGSAIYLSDLGRVYMGYKDASDEVFINGQPGVYISIKKQSGANSVKVADALYEKIEEVKQSLPSDIKLEIISDDSVEIRDTLKILYSSAWQGILLAILILFIFLKSFKSTFIISISIPFSIIITLLTMNFFHITLNVMTLTGLILGIGMVVDASIVMIDNIYSYRMRGTKAKVAAILGTQEMISSVVSGNLTTIVVFVPFLLFMKDLGFIGLMAKDMIYTIVIAIVSSLFVAIFLVPVLAGHYMPLTNRSEKPVKNKTLVFLYGLFEKVFDEIQNVYKKILSAALSHKAMTVIISFGLFIASFALVPFLYIELMPESEGQSITMNITLPTGTSLEKTTEIVHQFESFVQDEVKGFKTILASTGVSGGMEDSYASNLGSLSVFLPSPKEQIDTSSAIKEKLEKHFKDFPGIQFNFASDSMENMAGSDIDILVKGNDIENARAASEQIMTLIQKMPDLRNVKMDMKNGLPQLEIEIDRKRAYSFGVSVEAAANEINGSVAGVSATKYRQSGNEYDVIISYQKKDKSSIPDLEKIMAQGKDGLVSLSNFASVKKNYGPVSINHENKARAIHITAGIRGNANAPDVEAAIKKAIRENCVFTGDVNVSFEGSWKNMKKQAVLFSKIIVLAVLLVFGVMAGMYGSFKKPFINLFTIPFMIIGVLLIYFLKGQTVSIMTMVGLVMLVGIVVNNGIVLVDYTGLLVARGLETGKACLEAGTSRLRPVLMTTLTTILGMLPMSFTSQGSSSLVQPIGLCVVGGLVSSTFVTLILIPVLYAIMCKGEEKFSAETEKGDSKNSCSSEKKKLCRCEIIANQSVEDDIIELLEKSIPDFEYTVDENLRGRGRKTRKLGNNVWPEMNFAMTAYVDKKQAGLVEACVNQIKEKFPREGINLFVI
ncbi:MAG: efflux RND transporter permease subunit [Treponema sp.]|nr:efflux RND transporter permease subunit [Treponema sp.]